MADGQTNPLRIPGPIGRRAWSFAFEVAERMRYLGAEIGLHEITFRKDRHARNFLKLQARDEKEGVV